MKIKMDGEKIVKGVKKVDGIEIVLENTGDAKEGIDLIIWHINGVNLSAINISL